jgi:hypothetical protein
MATVTSGREKADKAWIAILGFSLLVFILFDFLWVVVLAMGWLERSRMVVPSLLFLWATWSAWKALQRRISNSDRQSSS